MRRSCRVPLAHFLAHTGRGVANRRERRHAMPERGKSRKPLCEREFGYLIWTPEIAREITSRWISEVPSKMS